LRKSGVKSNYLEKNLKLSRWWWWWTQRFSGIRRHVVA